MLHLSIPSIKTVTFFISKMMMKKFCCALVFETVMQIHIDRSRHSLKCVPCITLPYTHQYQLDTLKEKENHESTKQVMKRINYAKYNQIICVELKNCEFIAWSETWLDNVSMFLCLWDRRARDQHCERKGKVGKNISYVR